MGHEALVRVPTSRQLLHPALEGGERGIDEPEGEGRGWLGVAFGNREGGVGREG